MSIHIHRQDDVFCQIHVSINFTPKICLRNHWKYFDEVLPVSIHNIYIYIYIYGRIKQVIYASYLEIYKPTDSNFVR